MAGSSSYDRQDMAGGNVTSPNTGIRLAFRTVFEIFALKTSKIEYFPCFLRIFQTNYGVITNF